MIRKHGRKAIIMEAVKGGGLAKLPEEAEAVDAMWIYRESAPIKLLNCQVGSRLESDFTAARNNDLIRRPYFAKKNVFRRYDVGKIDSFDSGTKSGSAGSKDDLVRILFADQLFCYFRIQMNGDREIVHLLVQPGDIGSEITLARGIRCCFKLAAQEFLLFIQNNRVTSGRRSSGGFEACDTAAYDHHFLGMFHLGEIDLQFSSCLGIDKTADEAATEKASIALLHTSDALSDILNIPAFALLGNSGSARDSLPIPMISALPAANIDSPTNGSAMRLTVNTGILTSCLTSCA